MHLASQKFSDTWCAIALNKKLNGNIEKKPTFFEKNSLAFAFMIHVFIELVGNLLFQFNWKQIHVDDLCRPTKNIWNRKSSNLWIKLKLYDVTGKNYY